MPASMLAASSPCILTPVLAASHVVSKTEVSKPELSKPEDQCCCHTCLGHAADMPTPCTGCCDRV